MKISEEIDYLKNELKSYKYLTEQIDELCVHKTFELKKIMQRISEVEDDLNHNSPKSPSFDVASSSSSSNIDKPLALVIKLDDLKDRYKEVELDYDTKIKTAVIRVKYIEECLKAIDDKEKEILNDLYNNRIGFNEVCEKYGYSRSHLYRVVEKIIKKMVKKP